MLTPIQYIHMSHATTDTVIRHPDVAFVNFTGSVPGGKSVYQAVASKFIGISSGGCNVIIRAVFFCSVLFCPDLTCPDLSCGD